MTDEPTGESLEVQDNATAEPAPDDATQVQAQADDDATLPERFRGKSKSEIAQAYEELNSKLGDQGRELGELRNEVNFQKTQTQFQQQGQQPQVPQQQQAWTQPNVENMDDKFLESPTQTFMHLMNQYDIRRRYQDNARALPGTLREAERLEPKLFGDKEITKQVETYVRQGVQSGVIPPETQGDTDSLIAMAVHLKYQKDRQNPPPTQPVSPVQTETPVQVKQTTPTVEPIQLNETGQSFANWAKERGIVENDEEIAKMVRGED